MRRLFACAAVATGMLMVFPGASSGVPGEGGEPLIIIVEGGGGEGGGGGDATAPSAITDLAVLGTDKTSVDLAWTAPGDDGMVGTASRYDLRYSTAGPITTRAAFDAATPASGVPAPMAAGTAQTMTVSGLAPNTTYSFCMVAVDEAGNTGAVSNSPAGTTQSDVDTTAPAAIWDLAAANATESSVLLQWTAPGDDGMSGDATAYDLRISTAGPIVTDQEFNAATPVAAVPAPAGPGTAQFVWVESLPPGTACWFAIRTRDEVYNWSPVSNVASATTGVPGGSSDEKSGGCSSSAAGGARGVLLAALAVLALGYFGRTSIRLTTLPTSRT